jgi:hypothetical protein
MKETAFDDNILADENTTMANDNLATGGINASHSKTS